MQTPKIAGFIATDRSQTAIYGTGTTADEAIADALREIQPDDRYSAADFVAVPASAALLAQVASVGGAISWGSVGGVACTAALAAAARDYDDIARELGR